MNRTGRLLVLDLSSSSEGSPRGSMRARSASGRVSAHQRDRRKWDPVECEPAFGDPDPGPRTLPQGLSEEDGAEEKQPAFPTQKPLSALCCTRREEGPVGGFHGAVHQTRRDQSLRPSTTSAVTERGKAVAAAGPWD